MFGEPQKDVCSQCEEFQAKLKNSNLSDAAKRVIVGEKLLHIRRRKIFYKLKEIQERCKKVEMLQEHTTSPYAVLNTGAPKFKFIM